MKNFIAQKKLRRNMQRIPSGNQTELSSQVLTIVQPNLEPPLPMDVLRLSS